MGAGNPSPTRHIVVMGVTGVGKSTVARLVASALAFDLAEGDDFHPLTNVAKMAEGTPLTDDDRWPWLESLAEWTAQHRATGRSTVLTCSALRRAYRDVLRKADAATFFVHLHGPEDVIAARMRSREHFHGPEDVIAARMRSREHFMPVSLLQSQLETLEPLGPDERGVVVDVAAPIHEEVAVVLTAIRADVVTGG